MTRWLKRIGLLILVCIAAQQLLMHLDRRAAWSDLEAALAEVDAADPGWRWEDIESRRPTPAPEVNSAVVMDRAFQAFPKDWQTKVLDQLNEVPPPMMMPDTVVKRLDDELGAIEPALVEARKLIDCPAGRFPLELTDDFMSTLVVEQQNARSVVAALTLDMRRRLHEGDVAAALARLRAILNAARAFAEEPLLISQLLRIAFQSIAVQHLERTLAQGQAKPHDLAELQSRLAAEAAARVFVVGMRGERAGSHVLLSNIESGKLSLSPTLEGMLRQRRREPALWDRVNDYFARTMVLRSHAWLLRYQTRLIDAAQGNGLAMYQAIDEVAREGQDLRANFDPNLTMARLLAPAAHKIAEAEQRLDTLLACGQAGLAAERFRLAHGRWPQSLDELVKHKLLDAVPEDLFNGQPLRFRATMDGIVIWSVGKDLVYEGDALDNPREFDPNFIRVEFRLWNPEQRRQPPLPVKDDEDAEER